MSDEPVGEDIQATSGHSTEELLEQAWGIIANAGWDDSGKTDGWQEAAERWRDRYHDWLRQYAS